MADSKASSDCLLTPDEKCSVRILAQSVRLRPVSAAIDRASLMYSSIKYNKQSVYVMQWATET